VVTKDRRYADDLPTIGISRLRATGVITRETTEFTVRLGDVEQVVPVTELRFPCGGGWSRFVAPCCGKRVRLLKLLNGRLLCCRCLRKHRVFYRSELMTPKRRAELRVPKLLAMLNSGSPLRLKSSTMGGKMMLRSRHQEALERNLLVLKRHDLAALKRALAKAKE
jgi:hypothetical protein